MSLIVLVLVLVVALILVPLGLPGTWIMVAAAVAYDPLTGKGAIGLVTLVGILLLALAAELIEYAYSMRYTRKYGGSRRAAWGAIIGGIAGTFLGVPVMIIGPVIGAFVGAFAGALLAELTKGSSGQAATRVAAGAFLGRLAGTAVKCAIGVLIALWTIYDALV